MIMKAAKNDNFFFFSVRSNTLLSVTCVGWRASGWWQGGVRVASVV
jgi:hypothetical protein